MSSFSVEYKDLEGMALLPKKTKNSPSSKPDDTATATTTTTTTADNTNNDDGDHFYQHKNFPLVLEMIAMFLVIFSALIYNYCFNGDNINISSNNKTNNSTMRNEFVFEMKTEQQHPLDFEVLFPNDDDEVDDDVFAAEDDFVVSAAAAEDTSMVEESVESDENEQALSLNGPIPPFHPHHTAFVTYSAHMSSGGSVEYRRDTRVPCNYGMLVFTVGLAKDDLPYRYEIYNDVYLFSDNHSLCIWNPWYTGYQVSHDPFWTLADPTSIEVKHLDEDKMHWISSRVINPYGSKKKYDRQKTGDYIVVAKHDFYDVHYYQALKAAVNQWK
eukprot:scaffold22048_cov73-Cylindrotheca_fusiformis.AAC.1